MAARATGWARRDAADALAGSWSAEAARMSAPGTAPPPGQHPDAGGADARGVRRVHLIGIGGAGMRNLAKLLLARGIEVSGSDLKDSKGLPELARAGCGRVGRPRRGAGSATPTPS